jgi:hypothetical protein
MDKFMAEKVRVYTGAAKQMGLGKHNDAGAYPTHWASSTKERPGASGPTHASWQAEVDPGDGALTWAAW